MRLLSLFALLCSFYSTLVFSDIVFINPPPYAEKGYDLSQNPCYARGSTLNVNWTAGPTENKTSLALYQLNGTTSMYPYEYIAYEQDARVTSLTWTVNTTKDLTFSNIFWICLFDETEAPAVACTHFFNITDNEAGSLMAVIADASPSMGSTTTTTSSFQLDGATATLTTLIPMLVPSPTSTETAIAIAGAMEPDAITPITTSITTSMSTTPTPTPTPTSSAAPSAQSSSDLTPFVKAGVGIGVAVGALFVAGVGWFAFDRCKKWRKTPVETNSRTRDVLYRNSPDSFLRDKLRENSIHEVPGSVSGWY